MAHNKETFADEEGAGAIGAGVVLVAVFAAVVVSHFLDRREATRRSTAPRPCVSAVNHSTSSSQTKPAPDITGSTGRVSREEILTDTRRPPPTPFHPDQISSRYKGTLIPLSNNKSNKMVTRSQTGSLKPSTRTLEIQT